MFYASLDIGIKNNILIIFNENIIVKLYKFELYKDVKLTIKYINDLIKNILKEYNEIFFLIENQFYNNLLCRFQCIFQTILYTQNIEYKIIQPNHKYKVYKLKLKYKDRKIWVVKEGTEILKKFIYDKDIFDILDKYDDFFDCLIMYDMFKLNL